MKTIPIAIAVALAMSTFTVLGQDPGASPTPNGSPPPGEGGHRPGRGFHILPPHAEKVLNLTDDQKKQIADLEAEVKAKIEQILTPEQLAQLKQMRPPPPPGGPGKGPGGPPPEGGEHGGHGGHGTPPVSGSNCQP